jgi:5-methylcytosine-specific restriction endonuclease McrA
MDISVYSNAVVIGTSANRGAGTYFVASPRELEAILIGVTRRHKYQLTANYTSTMSRHIPENVRREVWQRDGGRCVRCQATDYLEFDHIIPHSRGGASTVANVQLLCRRCNLLKKDRI